MPATKLLPILFLASALLQAPHLAAQVAPVRGTGCPNAAFPKWSGGVRLGQSLSFSWSCKAPDVAFAALGWPSGGGISFDRPITCVAGPCRWYPAPIQGVYGVFGVSGPIGRWTLPIPNDRSLIFRTFALQAGCFRGSAPCFTLSGALSFAISP